jgi:hypothetical protein
MASCRASDASDFRLKAEATNIARPRVLLGNGSCSAADISRQCEYCSVLVASGFSRKIGTAMPPHACDRLLSWVTGMSERPQRSSCWQSPWCRAGLDGQRCHVRISLRRGHKRPSRLQAIKRLVPRAIKPRVATRLLPNQRSLRHRRARPCISVRGSSSTFNRSC